jgi:hypothetical protein
VTWVLGTGVAFGYGALIGDVRVTFADGTEVDALQKIHPVGRNLMAGFSGSVEVGFKMIDDLQRSFGNEQTIDLLWHPSRAAWIWRRRARRIFACAPKALRDCGCSLLLVGAWPNSDRELPAYARCVRMIAPEFTPERVRHFTWASIGSGQAHDLAHSYANANIETFARGWGRAEVMNPGGAALHVAHSIAYFLRLEPVAGVSDWMQVCIVAPGGFQLKIINVSLQTPAGEFERLQPPALVKSRNEFRQRFHGGAARAPVA